MIATILSIIFFVISAIFAFVSFFIFLMFWMTNHWNLEKLTYIFALIFTSAMVYLFFYLSFNHGITEIVFK